jgi:hypothetical protein
MMLSVTADGVWIMPWRIADRETIPRWLPRLLPRTAPNVGAIKPTGENREYRC